MQSPQSEGELEALRRSVLRGAPFGETTWQERTAKRLGLESTLRARGRQPTAASAKASPPRKSPDPLSSAIELLDKSYPAWR